MKRIIKLVIIISVLFFTIPLSGQPANDECVNAIALPDISSIQTVIFDLTGATESMDASCENATSTNLDIWYSFTMPYDGSVQLANVFGVDALSLFDGCGGNELGCFKNDNFFYGLTGGTTYILRYSAVTTSASEFTIQAFAPVVNDECVGAIDLGDVSIAQTVDFDTRGATESLDSSCETPTFDNTDLWFSFDMPFDGSVRLSSVFGVDGLSIYDACGGTEIGCFGGNDFFYGLTSGSTYYLRYSAISPRINDFVIQAFPIVANDECADGLAIGDISSSQQVTIDNRGATESLDASCETASAFNADLWYYFTMPYDGSIQLTSIFGLDVVSVYDACLGSELGCLRGNGFIYNLSGGTTYQLRYAAVSPRVDDFFIQAFGIVANDACTDPITIGDISTEQIINFDNRGATESLDASCESAGNENIDLWYEFVMPFSGNVQVSGVFGVDGLSIYDVCGGTELDCFLSSDFFYGLTQGTTYLLRYAAVSPRVNSFAIQAFVVVENDDCDNAILLNDVSVVQTIDVDTREATESIDGSCETASDENKDLWYTFTMPVNGNLRVTDVFGFDGVTLLDGCGGSELACLKGNGYFYGLTQSTDYLLRYSAAAPRVNDFDVQAFSTVTNDICNSATLLDISSPVTVPVDNRGSTESMDASCENIEDDNMDLWYSFVMPEDGTLDVTGLSAGEQIALFDGCSGSEIDCLTTNGQSSSLFSGNTYLLRYATVDNFSGPDQFSLTMSSLLPVELADFSISKSVSGDVVLSWMTYSEVNNEKFEVLRSENGVDWTKIGEERGFGTTTETHTYKFIDDPSGSGLMFYRLKQVDFDGAYEYSDVKTIEMNAIESTWRIYPNPATNAFTFQGFNIESIEKIYSYNSAGLRYNLTMNKYGEINTSNLETGIYLLHIRTYQNKVYRTKLLIQ